MKYTTFIAVAALSLLAPFSYAQQDEPLLDKGTRELALSGTIEIPEFEEVDYDIDVSFGYFVADGWELGVRAVGAEIGESERFDFSLFTEYNFNRQSNVVPYIGASVGVATVDFDDFDVGTTLTPEDDESTVFGIQGGIKWFVRPYMAVTTSIAFNVSTEDIYLADNELQDNLTRIRLGLRYYF
jgi:hypothetical protein